MAQSRLLLASMGGFSSALQLWPRACLAVGGATRATSLWNYLRRGFAEAAPLDKHSVTATAAAAASEGRIMEELGSSTSSSAFFDALRRVDTGHPQLTLAGPVSRGGVGLHSGKIAELRLLPAVAGDGRYFVVGDAEDGENCRIPARLDYVKETTLSTCLGKGNRSVGTVEHLLSALEGLGVDNCRIEIRKGREVPLRDGSALDWVEAIDTSGLSLAEDEEGCHQSRKTIVLGEPISVRHGDSFVAGFPASSTLLTYGIDFPQVRAIGQQWFTCAPGDRLTYRNEVAPARTFGIYEQINQLQAAGLIKGGSLENALVCSMETGWLNPPLRFPDEPCRHKLLDLIGDLALCAYKGHPGLPLAHIVAYKEALPETSGLLKASVGLPVGRRNQTIYSRSYDSWLSWQAGHALHVKFGEALLQAGLK